MIIAILLWLLCSVITIYMIARTDGKLHLCDITGSILIGPIAFIIVTGGLISTLVDNDHIIWKRKND